MLLLFYTNMRVDQIKTSKFFNIISRNFAAACFSTSYQVTMSAFFPQDYMDKKVNIFLSPFDAVDLNFSRAVQRFLSLAGFVCETKNYCILPPHNCAAGT